MNCQEALTFLDNKIALSPTQRAIFKAAWEKRSYRYLAFKMGVTESSVKQQAYLLWAALSKILGVKVKKSNLSSVFLPIKAEA